MNENQPPTSQKLKKEIKDPRKCPAHNMWMRRGQCEICRMESDRRTRAFNETMGIVPQEIKITKV